MSADPWIITTSGGKVVRANGLSMGSIAGVRRVVTGLFNIDKLRLMNRTLLAWELSPDYHCPCCAYRGKFQSYGLMNRPSAQCPRCGSLERHRLLKLAVDAGFVSFEGRNVLHFAPEPVVSELIMRSEPQHYQTADIAAGRAMRELNIEAIDDDDDKYDVIVASHVLEHVDDAKALGEVYRVLKSTGQFVALVPIVEGWSHTYEDASKISDVERLRHFGQHDHLRQYGRDFRSRLASVGFLVNEFTADGAIAADFGLIRGETVFLANKCRLNGFRGNVSAPANS